MVGPTPDLRSIDPTAVAVFEVRPGLWNLRIPLVWPGISHVNVAVLAGADGGGPLVDCGTAGDPTCWNALVNGLSETGHGIADVTDLVVTHAHSDHFGLASRVVAESGCTMWMHPAHEAFTDSALEPERIYAARERRARAGGRAGPVRRHRRGNRLRALPAARIQRAPHRDAGSLCARSVGRPRDAGPLTLPRLPLPAERAPAHSRRPRLAHLCALVRLRLHRRSRGGAFGVAFPGPAVGRRPGAPRPRSPDRGSCRGHRHARAGARAATRTRRGGGGTRAGAGLRDREACVRPIPLDDGRGR